MVEDVIRQIDQIGHQTPDKLVYDYLGNTATYGDLKQKSDALAHYIDTLNIPSDQAIIVYGAQTFEMIATFQGVVKSGHAYIPIDTHSPEGRVPMIATIAKPALIIAVEPLVEEVNGVRTIKRAELDDIMDQEVSYELDHEVQGDDNFYIIFTSGTTGQPKGVQISHTNLLSFVNWIVDDIQLPANLVALSQAPYSFDLSVMDLYPTLVSGGQLKALPKKVTDNFGKMFQMLPQMGLSYWVSTPSFMDVCLLNPAFSAEKLPELKLFLFCGEELTKKTVATLKVRFPGARIFNTYGPTEATVAVSALEITDDVLAKYDRLPIGYPKPDVQVTVVNHENGEPTTDEGELIITGDDVSKGYLNNPEKTAAAFFKSSGVQSYRTGDLGYKDEDGLLFYRGRTDFQIKLHGYRIELEEVNHYLNANHYVKQAVAVPKYDKDHKVAQLLGYVVPSTNDFEKEIDLTKALKETLKGEMMEYMIPNRFVYVDSLPVSQNGKVDIKALISEVNDA